MNETNARMDAQTVEDFERALKELYDEYKQTGRISHHGNIEKVNKCSYREMVRKFVEVIETIRADIQ